MGNCVVLEFQISKSKLISNQVQSSNVKNWNDLIFVVWIWFGIIWALKFDILGCFKSKNLSGIPYP